MVISPIRIAYIDHTGAMGGAEHLLLSLLKQLPSEDIEPMVICGQNGPLLEECKKIGVNNAFLDLPKFHSISWVVRGKKVLNPFAILVNFIRLLIASSALEKKLNPYDLDLVQTNCFFSHIYGALAAKRLKVSCVWHFHDLMETNRFCGLINWVWSKLVQSLPTWIVADSKAVLDHVDSGKKGIVIYPGVDFPSLLPKETPALLDRLRLSGKPILVGSLGRITYAKGLDILIQAAAMVVQLRPEIHFVIFGGTFFGEENYKIELDQMVLRAGLSDHWHWMGYEKYAKEYLHELDLVVFPSRREAFGLSACEAGLAGKVVIATSVGGIPEIIENGLTGVLVPPGNAKKLAESILYLVDHPVEAKLMGDNARERIRNQFNLQRLKDEFLKFYRQVQKPAPKKPIQTNLP